VLYFGDREDDDELLAKLDINDEVTAGNAVCFRVKKPAEAEPAAESILPPDRLGAADLWAVYGITEADTFVVADRYGNPYHTGKETALLTKLGEVNKHFRSVRKELKKFVKDARDARDKKDIAKALESLKQGFELGLNGYVEATDARKLYDEIIKSGRDSLKDADAKALEGLARTFKGTDLEAEIEKARKQAAKDSN
jgi:hypothetical protein